MQVGKGIIFKSKKCKSRKIYRCFNCNAKNEKGDFYFRTYYKTKCGWWCQFKHCVSCLDEPLTIQEANRII